MCIYNVREYVCTCVTQDVSSQEGDEGEDSNTTSGVWLCVRVCLYAYVCVNVYRVETYMHALYVYIYTQTDVLIYIRIHTYIYACSYIYICIYKYLHMCAWVYLYKCIYVFICTSIYLVFLYPYTHTHTQTYPCVPTLINIHTYTHALIHTSYKRKYMHVICIFTHAHHTYLYVSPHFK